MDVISLPNCSTRRVLDAEYKTFSIAVNGLLTTAFVVLGTLGNLSSMKFVRIANFDKNRGVVLAVSLMALAIWDTLLLWCAFFYYSLKSITQALNVEQRFDVLTLCFHPAIQIANTASIWCVVVITVQRYVASKDPFATGRRGRLSLIGNPTLMTTFRRERRASSIGVYWAVYRRHFRLPLILSVLAVLINIPAFFELMIISCLKRDTIELFHELRVTDLRMNKQYKIWYRVVCRMAFNTFGPNMLILLLTLLTLLKLRGTNRSRNKMFQRSLSVVSREAAKENIQTAISFALVVKFLLFRSMIAFLDLWEVTIGYGHMIETFIYLVDCSNFLVIFNSATNCLVYLKGRHWLERTVQARQSRSSKEQKLQSSKHISLLARSWTKIVKQTEGQFGVRLVFAMLRKNSLLFDSFTQDMDCDTNGYSRRSFDLLASPKCQEVGDRITTFVGELLSDMAAGESDEAICAKIRRVGAVHYDRGLVFNAFVWREFKVGTLTMVGECEYGSDVERNSTLAAWNTFVSVIIREMKMGFWIKDEAVFETSTT